jgi:hypothetical protein
VEPRHRRQRLAAAGCLRALFRLAPRSLRSHALLRQSSSFNCYEYSARNLECERPYAPAAADAFRAQWLQYRQHKQVLTPNA